jgi:hypothetical protein
MEMIDLMDTAIIYNKADPSVYQDGQVRGSQNDQDIVFGVRRLDVRPPLLLGAASPDSWVDHPANPPETLFFILDTRTGKRTDEASLDALQADAIQFGGPLKLEPVSTVYGHYRYGKADLIPGIAFAIPPIIALFFLTRALLRLRATRIETA